jgi:iron(III) transport system ATP-binding protein
LEAINSIDRAFSTRSTSVYLKNLVKKFKTFEGSKEFTAVNNISLEIRQGELTTLLGPSGCGKTTTLRMIAGFEFPTSGDILLGEQSVVNVPPNKRDIAMMFQSYALFPHLTIYENIAYGLKIKKLPKEEIKERTDKVIDLMQLRGMENRYPAQVSGGQQQRIALARAVVIEPKVLLFDEPLSNLDAKLREYMRDELRKLQQRLGITSIYVTHDQSEAMAISDNVVIMNNGNIVQSGSPRDIYEHPKSKFVANFMGKSNFIEGEIIAKESDGIIIKVGSDPIKVPNPGNSEIKLNEKVVMVVRPEAVTLSKNKELITGIITRATYYGAKAEYEVKVNENLLIVENINPQITGMFDEGEKVGIHLELDCIRLLPSKDEQA